MKYDSYVASRASIQTATARHLYHFAEVFEWLDRPRIDLSSVSQMNDIQVSGLVITFVLREAKIHNSFKAMIAESRQKYNVVDWPLLGVVASKFHLQDIRNRLTPLPPVP